MRQEVKKIAKDIYCIYTPSYYNCTYLIYRNDEVTLIDTGMKSDASDVKQAMQHLNIDLNKIRSILLTHWHNDHSAGTAELKELTNCSTYCHVDEAPYFERKQSSKIRRLADYIPEHGLFVLFKGLIGDTVPRSLKIDCNVKHGDVVAKTFEVISTPGHTMGHVSYYDKESKFLFAGDSLAVINGKLRLMARPVTLDLNRSKSSILSSFSNREIQGVCPGHREVLLKNVPEEIERFNHYLHTMKKWPLLG